MDVARSNDSSSVIELPPGDVGTLFVVGCGRLDTFTLDLYCLAKIVYQILRPVGLLGISQILVRLIGARLIGARQVGE